MTSSTTAAAGGAAGVGPIEGLGTAYLYDFVDTRDLVIMVGFDPVEFDRDWTARARIVHTGVVPNDDRYYGSEVEIVGPIDIALERLSASGTATKLHPPLPHLRLR